MLKMLHPKQGTILTRTEILNRWEDDKEYTLGTNIIDVYINHLRKKLGAKKIETVRGFGFKIRVK